MSRLPVVLAASLLVVTAACAPKTPAAALPSEDVLRAMADSVDRSYVAAFNLGNPDAVMAVYFKTPDVVSVGLDGSILTGYDALAADWKASLTEMPASTLAFSDSHNTVIGDAVLGYGRWTLTPKDGQSPSLEGPYTILKAYRNGRMAIILDHASVPQT
jgi:ketosteroid isomerase-like protein